MRSIWNAPGITEVEVERSPCIFYFKIILTLRPPHTTRVETRVRGSPAPRGARANSCTALRSPALSAIYIRTLSEIGNAMPKMRAATGTAAVPGYSAYGFRAGCAPLYEKVKPYYKRRSVKHETRYGFRINTRSSQLTRQHGEWCTS